MYTTTLLVTGSYGVDNSLYIEFNNLFWLTHNKTPEGFQSSFGEALLGLRKDCFNLLLQKLPKDIYHDRENEIILRDRCRILNITVVKEWEN